MQSYRHDNCPGDKGYIPHSTRDADQQVQIITLVLVINCINREDNTFWQNDPKYTPLNWPPKKECPPDILDLTEKEKQIQSNYLLSWVEKILDFLREQE